MFIQIWHCPFIIYVLLSTFPFTLSLVAYDCGHSSSNYTSFSLLDVEPCDIKTNESGVTTEIIQLVQLKKNQPVPTIHCLVEIFRTVERCSWFDDSQMVSGGIGSYIYETTLETCQELHRTGTLYVDKNIKLAHITKNSTTTRSVVLAGSLGQNGKCHGDSYSDSFGSWEGVVVQAVIKVTVQDQIAHLDLKSGDLRFVGGSRCRFSDGRCMDSYLGNSFWSTELRTTCIDDDYDVLYEGPSQFSILDASWDPNRRMGVYTVENHDSVFALTTKGATYICQQPALSTDHPRLYILKRTPTGFLRSRSSVDVLNADIFTYINTKFVYLNTHFGKQLKALYHSVLAQECILARDTLKQRLLIAQISPNEFAYIQGEGPGYTAVVGGEIIYLIQFKPVPVSLRPTTSCYTDIPIAYNNNSCFMSNKNRLVKRYSTEISCSTLMPNVVSLEHQWYALSPSPRPVQPPEILSHNIKETWTFVSPGNLATSGIYSQQELEALSEHIMYPMELPDITHTLSRTLFNPLNDRQGLNYDRLLDETSLEKVVSRVSARLWGFFSLVGNVTSSILGFYVIWKLLKVTIDTIINALMLKDTFGYSWKLILSGIDSITHYCLNKRHLETYYSQQSGPSKEESNSRSAITKDHPTPIPAPANASSPLYPQIYPD